MNRIFEVERIHSEFSSLFDSGCGSFGPRAALRSVLQMFLLKVLGFFLNLHP